MITSIVVLFFTSCNKQENIIEKDLTISEVKEVYDLLSHLEAKGRKTESMGILWEAATYKEFSIGDALVFPVTSPSNQYVRMEEMDELLAVENVSHAFAYKNKDESVQLDYVQVLPTVDSDEFTGFVLVSDWNGEVKHTFQYEDGILLENEELKNSRLETEYCSAVHYYECTSVSSGGVEYGGHCNLIGISRVCINTGTPPSLAPDDFGGGGGGDLQGDGPSLCEHPFVEGEYIQCGTCVDGYIKDANNNCVKEKDIFIDLNDPYLKNVANKWINKNLSNDINQAIIDIFNDNNYSVNLVLRENTFRNKLASTNPPVVDVLGNIHVNITFNPNLIYGASQEYIAAVLYHEAIHAYLGINQFSNNELKQHYEIAREYLSWISRALREVFPSLSQKEAKGLSLRFLKDVSVDDPAYFNELLQGLGFENLQELIDVTDSYRDGNSGTNCL